MNTWSHSMQLGAAFVQMKALAQPPIMLYQSRLRPY